MIHPEEANSKERLVNQIDSSKVLRSSQGLERNNEDGVCQSIISK
jgi:hypothetical protein